MSSVWILCGYSVLVFISFSASHLISLSLYVFVFCLVWSNEKKCRELLKQIYLQLCHPFEWSSNDHFPFINYIINIPCIGYISITIFSIYPHILCAKCFETENQFNLKSNSIWWFWNIVISIRYVAKTNLCLYLTILFILHLFVWWCGIWIGFNIDLAF